MTAAGHFMRGQATIAAYLRNQCAAEGSDEKSFQPRTGYLSVWKA
jgi:hypothetical protein